MPTIFQQLNRVLSGDRSKPQEAPKQTVNYYTLPYKQQPQTGGNDIIFRTTSKEEYEQKRLQSKQQRLLNAQWYKAGLDNAIKSTQELTNLQMMYRDAQIMDTITPEIGAALDIVSEEACMIGSSGKMLIVSSKSDRIKSILEDLFYNRLDLHIMLPMICRGMCKYGNDFMFLNLDEEEGVKGWMELPVMEIQRIENGMTNPYQAVGAINQQGAIKTNATQFLWYTKQQQTPLKFFQVAHFRLITDSTFLPYGVSWLHKARRSWKMLSMMEDMMLIYRLERSIERRIFKIYTGDIDENDVQAYVQQVANQFKRTEIIDPETGQVDLRKNFLSVDTDYFIPFRSEDRMSKIEPLQAVSNQTSMDDIEYMRGKMLAALRVPKAFLNFQDTQGKGQNLAFMDVRFARMINRIQQALLMELNKIAIVHLFLMGFTDDINNFTLTMHNPSSQVQQQELDMMVKKVNTMQQLLSDPGNGIQIYSYHRALKEVMGLSDTEIAENLNEIRLERALAAELENTSQIIKKTGLFDPTDRIYGDINAKYNYNLQPEGGPGGDLGGGGAPMGGGPVDLGGDMDNIDSPGAEGEGDVSGNEEGVNMENASSVDQGSGPMNENKKLIPRVDKSWKPQVKYFEEYVKLLSPEDVVGNGIGRVQPTSENVLINEEITNMTKELTMLTELSEDLNKLISDESEATVLHD